MDKSNKNKMSKSKQSSRHSSRHSSVHSTPILKPSTGVLPADPILGPLMVQLKEETDFAIQRNASVFNSQLDSSFFSHEKKSRLRKFLPILDWLPRYSKKKFKADFVAGLSVGLMLVPQSIAHAAIAGIEPLYGMYTGFAGTLFYPFTASCRQLAVGTGAVLSLLAGAELDIFEGKGHDNITREAAGTLLCCLVGIWSILLGVLGLGYICSFLSSPVMNGSLTGAAFIIMSTQLKHLIGVSYPRSSYFFETLYLFFTHLVDTKWLPLVVSIFSLLLLLFLRSGKRALKAGYVYSYIQPGSRCSRMFLMCADFSAVVISLIGIFVGLIVVEQGEEDILPMVGSLPSGILEIGNPFKHPEAIGDLLIPSFVMSLIGFVLAIALAKKLGGMFGYEVDASQELVALGIAGFAGSFFNAFPMQASLSRTMVNVQAGARTGMASWISSSMVLLGLLILKPALYYLPKASLAAIIEIAALKLIDFQMPRWLYTMAQDWSNRLRSDFSVWCVAFGVTLGVGVVYGITLGVCLSCLLLIERSTKPKYAILGRLPGTNVYRSVTNFPEALIRGGIVIVRFDASLHFANSGFFKDLLREIEKNVRLMGGHKKLHGIVIDMGCVNEVDATGVQTLREVLIEYENKDVHVVLANMKGSVRSTIKRGNLDEILNQPAVLIELDDAVEYLAPSKKKPDIQQQNTLSCGLSDDHIVANKETMADTEFERLKGMDIRRTESTLSIRDANIMQSVQIAMSRKFEVGGMTPKAHDAITVQTDKVGTFNFLDPEDEDEDDVQLSYFGSLQSHDGIPDGGSNSSDETKKAINGNKCNTNHTINVELTNRNHKLKNIKINENNNNLNFTGGGRNINENQNYVSSKNNDIEQEMMQMLQTVEKDETDI